MPKETFSWSALVRILMIRKRHIAWIALLTLLIYALSLSIPIAIQISVDTIINQGMSNILYIVILIALFSVLFESILTNIRQKMMINVGSFLDRHISKKAFTRMLGIRIHIYGPMLGDIMNQFQRAGQIRNFILDVVPQAAFQIGSSIVSLFLMFYYSPIVGIMTLIMAICFSLYINKTLGHFYTLSDDFFEADSVRQQTLGETISGYSTVKALALEATRIKKWLKDTDKAVGALRRVDNMSRRVTVSTLFATQSITLIVVVIGILQVVQGHLSLGELLALQILVSRVVAPIFHSADLARQFQDIHVSIDHLNTLMSNPLERAAHQNVSKLESYGNSITANNLTLKYAGKSEPALEAVSFKLPERGVIALVGRNGSGKTSLVRAILGLAPFEGSLQIAGRPVNDYHPRKLRASIGIYDQDTTLFSGTVREAIDGRNLLSEADIWEALEFSGADQFVSQLEGGIHASLDVNGANLSGGQRQRMAISRAIAYNPSIAIFDEPTAFLDAEASSKLEAKLLLWGADRLLVMATHNMLTAKKADMIVVLNDARLVSIGNHDELISNCQIYRLLSQDYMRK